jgi:capsular exopolysaccharide synthesis family protein
MEQIKTEKSELNKLSARDFLQKYKKFFPLYILCIGLALLGAWLYLRYTQESYASTGSMILLSGGSTDGGNNSVDDILNKNKNNINLQNEIEVIRSKPLLTRVAKNLGLEFSYTAKGKIKDMNAYKKFPFAIEAIQLKDSTQIFSINIDFVSNSQFTINNDHIKYNSNQAFTTPDGIFKINKTDDFPAGSDFVIAHFPADRVAASIIPSLTVQPKVKGTQILTIQHETSNPDLAADVINELMSEYNALTIEQNNSSTDSIISFINRSLLVLNHDIDSLRRQLLAFQKTNDVISAETQLQEYMEGAKVQEELIQNGNLALKSLDQIETYLQKSGENKTSVPSALGVQDEILNGLIGQYNAAQLEKKQMLEANILPDNPRMKEQDKKIEAFKNSILENISVLRNSYRIATNIASSKKLKNKDLSFTMPAKAMEQAVMQKELDRKYELYSVLDGKRIEASLNKVSTKNASTIVEKAEPNAIPIKPQRRIIQIAALLIGLLLPTFFILLKELLNDKIGMRSDIEKITEAPILGEIGHSLSDQPLIVNKTSRSLTTEQFRILRSNLQYIIGKHEKAVIMVTTSFSGEGKSFISTNMAAVLALTDKKTIILEFDLRKPKILEGLEMNKKPGISNYITGNKELEEIIIPVANTENLFVLPCGPIPPNPAELLLSKRMDELFEKLKQQFDYLVIDTAPVGMVSDALTLGKFADCTLYVTRQNYTLKRQIGLIDEMYTGKKLPHISIVFNDVKTPTGGGYYYGSYSYGYGEKNKKNRNDYYYEDDIESKKNFGKKITDIFTSLI